MAHPDFANLLKNAIGLDQESIGTGSIDRAVRSRMDALKVDEVGSYWRHLHTSEQELQELIESVVVPETWFFRDREAFQSLVRLTSEEWLPAHANSVLRILSVPCCTGEEPYSIVMALVDRGIECRQIVIDAVDISTQALTRAGAGVYGSNSFRGVDLAFRERYFKPVPNGYRLADEIRNSVSFHHENLLSPDFRESAAPYDVIFCRNVLIYFDAPTQQRAMEMLSRLLAPKGFLFVGPAEASLAASTGFKTVHHSMSFAFRKHSIGTKGHGPTAPNKQINPSHKRPIRQDVPTTKVSAPPISLPTTTISIIPDLERASLLADSGQFREAAELCEAHLKLTGPTPRAFYLLGLVGDASGDDKRAAECYRKVLYLEPGHTEALFHLALLLEQQGDAPGAERLRMRARRGEESARR
jgi:chemotaxis protein methyltransferase WspC